MSPDHRRRGRRAGFVLLVLAVAWVPAACVGETGSSAPPAATAPSTTTALSTTSTTVATDVPGALIEAEELDDPAGAAEAWRIRYRSTSVEGEPVEVTGIVGRPRRAAPAGGYPVLAWAHGTVGVADECAPSLAGAGGLGTVQAFLDAGFVVAATDYEGLGGPGVHPYLVAESEGRGVLDAARAAAEVVGDVSASVVVMGHSQGGHAALAAAEIAGRWAPELEVTGTIAVAPVGDLERLISIGFANRDAFGFGALIVAGWSDAYSDLDAADVLTPAGRAVARLATTACVFDVFEAAPERSIDELVDTPPQELPAWERRIRDNTIHPDRIGGPVLVVQGTDDTLISSELTDDLVRSLCAAGVPVRYATYEGEGHGSVVTAAANDMVTWALDRLARRRPVPTCD